MTAVCPHSWRSAVSVSSLLLLLVTLAPREAAAVPIYFETTGHYYEFIDLSDIMWVDASVAATALSHEGMSGHLATLTSQAENDFVHANFGHQFSFAWLGGFEVQTPIPRAGWQWVTGEDWAYSNWEGGEPNDGGGPDHLYYLQICGNDTNAPGKWCDDSPETNVGRVAGYLVEFGGTAVPVPEPMTLTLLGLGLGVTALWTRARRRA